MEFYLTKTPAASLLEPVNTVSEQPVDVDFTLPDYCPDIDKILRCKITPKIYNRNLSGGQIQVEGTTVVSVLYEDSENGSLRICEQSVPFSAGVRVKDVPDDYVIETSVKCEYVNCRALSRRRLTVHGAFSLYVRLLTKGFIDLYSPNDTDNIEFKTSESEVSVLSSLAGDVFSVTDEIQIKSNPTAEVIIDSSAKATVTDFKIIPDKLMLSGEIGVKVLYISDIESGKPEKLDYIIPFSQVIDCAGIDEGNEVCVHLNVNSCDLSLKSDILSENPLINVDARISATVFAYSSKPYNIVTDAYSTEYCSEPEFVRVNIPSRTKMFSDTFMNKDTLRIDESEIKEVIDFAVSNCTLSSNISDGKIILTSKLNFNILGYNADNKPVYLERSVDVCKEVELEDSYNSVVCSDISVVSASYRFADDNNIEIRCELKYRLTLEDITCLRIVSSVNADESKPLNKKPCALILYYADKNEKIWDIAKRYNTKQSLILSENELSAEILEEPAMIFIPTA